MLPQLQSVPAAHQGLQETIENITEFASVASRSLLEASQTPPRASRGLQGPPRGPLEPLGHLPGEALQGASSPRRGFSGGNFSQERLLRGQLLPGEASQGASSPRRGFSGGNFSQDRLLRGQGLPGEASQWTTSPRRLLSGQLLPGEASQGGSSPRRGFSGGKFSQERLLRG